MGGPPAPAPLPRRLLAEAIGTGLLVTVVVGSGVAASRLSPHDPPVWDGAGAVLARAGVAGVFVGVRAGGPAYRVTGRRSTIKKTTTPPWTFAAACATSAGLCSVTDLASAKPAPADDSAMLCGR